MTIHMLNQVFIKNLDVVETIRNVIKSTIKITDTETRIKNLENQKSELELGVSNLVDTKMKNKRFSDVIFNAKYDEYSQKIESIIEDIASFEMEHVKNYDTSTRVNKIEEVLKQKETEIIELDSDILRSIIFKMISVSPTKMVYCVAGSKNYTEQEFSDMRKKFIKKEPIATGVYTCEKYNKKMHYSVVVI